MSARAEILGAAAVAVIVPSLGRSPVAREAAERLRRELAGVDGELLWVSPHDAPPPLPLGGGERWLALDRPLGFAAAANRGFAETRARLVALVNDDALVEPGWLATLSSALDADAKLAAVQGVVLELDRPERCDGCGVGWNRWWQAVQIGRGERALPASAPSFEPFCVSATAALFRRSALERVTRGSARPFEERLGSWYEDVELGARLRADGFGVATLPRARALHFGSASGRSAPWRRRELLARNRILVVARLLGRKFPLALPRLAARDLIDALRAVAALELRAAAAIAAGWLEALVVAPHFVRAGAPLVAAAEIARVSSSLPIGSAE